MPHQPATSQSPPHPQANPAAHQHTQSSQQGDDVGDASSFFGGGTGGGSAPVAFGTAAASNLSHYEHQESTSHDVADLFGGASGGSSAFDADPFASSAPLPPQPQKQSRPGQSQPKTQPQRSSPQQQQQQQQPPPSHPTNHEDSGDVASLFGTPSSAADPFAQISSTPEPAPAPAQTRSAPQLQQQLHQHQHQHQHQQLVIDTNQIPTETLEQQQYTSGYEQPSQENPPQMTTFNNEEYTMFAGFYSLDPNSQDTYNQYLGWWQSYYATPQQEQGAPAAAQASTELQSSSIQPEAPTLGGAETGYGTENTHIDGDSTFSSQGFSKAPAITAPHQTDPGSQPRFEDEFSGEKASDCQPAPAAAVIISHEEISFSSGDSHCSIVRVSHDNLPLFQSLFRRSSGSHCNGGAHDC